MATSTRLTASPRVDSSVSYDSSSLWSISSPPKPAGIVFPWAYDLFMNPWTPLCFGLLYFVTAKTLSARSDGKNRLQGPFWKAAIIAHNTALAVYSGWTFLETAPSFFGAFARAYMQDGLSGLTHAFCDSDLTVWTATKFPYFAYTFYLSKYYEVVDTAIILLKGKKVGLLQSYHHMGAVWTMFAGVASSSMPIWIFVVFNSFIHTLMYSYYTFAALKWPFPNFLKKSLTKLQITQFLVGGSLAFSTLLIQIPSTAPTTFRWLDTVRSSARTTLPRLDFRVGSQCLVNQAQKTAVWLNVAYLIPLTYLFAAFFVESYRKRVAKNAAAASHGAEKVVKVE